MGQKFISASSGLQFYWKYKVHDKISISHNIYQKCSVNQLIFGVLTNLQFA